MSIPIERFGTGTPDLYVEEERKYAQRNLWKEKSKRIMKRKGKYKENKGGK